MLVAEKVLKEKVIKNWRVLLVIIAVMFMVLIPVIMAFLMQKVSIFSIAPGGIEEWIPFWGSYLGAVISIFGVVCTTIVIIKNDEKKLKKQLKEQEKNLKHQQDSLKHQMNIDNLKYMLTTMKERKSSLSKSYQALIHYYNDSLSSVRFELLHEDLSSIELNLLYEILYKKEYNYWSEKIELCREINMNFEFSDQFEDDVTKGYWVEVEKEIYSICPELGMSSFPERTSQLENLYLHDLYVYFENDIKDSLNIFSSSEEEKRKRSMKSQKVAMKRALKEHPDIRAYFQQIKNIKKYISMITTDLGIQSNIYSQLFLFSLDSQDLKILRILNQIEVDDVYNIDLGELKQFN